MAASKEMKDLEEYLTTAVSPQTATQRLRHGYESTRFVRVGSTARPASRVPLDLRPPPLDTSRFSRLSMRAVLNEGPPSPPFPPNFAPQNNDDNDTGKNQSESAKKQEAKSKKPFVKRVFSRKPEGREESPDVAKAELTRKGYSKSMSDDEYPLVSPQNQSKGDWDFICRGISDPSDAGLTTPEPLSSPERAQHIKVGKRGRKVSKGQKTPVSSPQSPSPFFRTRQARKPTLITPGQPTNTGPPLTDHSIQESNPFDLSFKKQWIPPPSTGVSPDFFTPRYSSSHPTPRNVSLAAGKAAKILGPEAPYTPPFGHERIERAEQKQRAERITREHLSLKNLPCISKEDISRLPKMLEPNLPEMNSSPYTSPYSAPPTVTTFGSSDESKYKRMFSPRGPPKPKRDRSGTVPPFDVTYPHNDSSQSRTHVDTHHHEEAGVRFPGDNTINTSVTQDSHANPFNVENPDSIGLAISKSISNINLRTEREDSYESAKSPAMYTPPTPHSGARTPKTPRDFDDFYSRPGPLATSPTGYGSDDLAASPAEMRHGIPAMPRRMPPPPPAMSPAETSVEPGPVFSSAARNIMRYFSSHWTEQGMRDLCAWIGDETRLDAVDFVRRCTSTTIRAHNGLGAPHPHHSREFTSRNLWCAQHQGRCALCDVPCCVYKEALQALAEAPTEQCRGLARQASKLIVRASGFEEEEETFL
ncbi:MAG: hypothetical protein Q9174_005638, partial [Haloplaca sp. 1 TL-2023]